ncbi:beta-N-acetylhexosaminidase [Paenibacillus harenae]|uniref:beta-N-acetylhexosaminidase n=1 Tax=Paenibacillus harenae TaxID=306543 RepID=UPI002791B05A|nr:beta-N-acetylhexosaminidase [Paenibacillus harenae]MDQ0058618.1 beta-N-acetylhexosaminidase [Paenibacillus harenae]
MARKTITLLVLLAVCFIIAGCGTGSNNNTDKPNDSSPSETTRPTATASTHTEPPPTETAKPAVDPIQEQIDGMTLEEKIGQMVIIGLEGTRADKDAINMINKNKIGGFILYKDNMNNADQIVSLLNALKSKNETNKVPLWLSVDQEGGKVNRLPKAFVAMPTAKSMGAADNENYTQAVGQATGLALKSLGFNMDFAPVLDINSNPDNPVIGNRSFGSDADTVIRHGIETMEGLRSSDIAAVVKHFPGHGDTSVDSHLELPVIGKSLSELKKFELLPFKEAIAQDADAVMVAHLLIPSLDDANPASLSKRIITDLLRDELGYDGVVMTDDMTMGGIVNHNDIGEAAVRSVLAGTDIVLVGHDNVKQIKVLNALKASAAEGDLTEEMINAHVHRILALKAKYALSESDGPINDIDIEGINNAFKEALNLNK